MADSSQLQRVVHNEIVGMSQPTTGTYSKILRGISEMPQHSIAIALSGATTGVVSVRARPVGASGFTKIAIESVDLATATLLSWSITGFYDGFALVVSTGIGVANMQLTVSSCVDGL